MARVFWNRVHNDPSRSFKVVDFGTNRKRVYDFLYWSPISNLSAVLLHFRDIRAFVRRKPFFDTPFLFGPKFRRVPTFPVEVDPWCWVYGERIYQVN